MRVLFLALTFLLFEKVWSQSPDDFVKKIEKLRSEGKLTSKSSADKTSVGAVAGYYHNGSLVMINSMTDAEAAGTETFYFIDAGILRKVFIISATFGSNNGWNAYYSKHNSADRCYSCHGEPVCSVTEVTLGDSPKIVITENNNKNELTQRDKEKMLLDVQRVFDEIKIVLKELD